MRGLVANLMNILMLADVFFPDTVGGAGRVAYHLSFELSARGHEVHVVTRNAEGALPSNQKLNRNFFVHRFATPAKESLNLILAEIKNSFFLARDLSKRNQFDLICIHQSLVAIGPLLAGILKAVPIVYYFHSPWHEEFLIKKNNIPSLKSLSIASIMKWMERLILKRANRVVVLSQFMKTKLCEAQPYPIERILKIQGGVDLNLFDLARVSKRSAKEKLGLPAGNTIFLTVRNLVPRMGIENLIESFNHSEILREGALLLIGGKGPLEMQFKKTVQKSNLGECIRFLGHVPDEDLPSFYQASDFFVLPTYELEGFGLVILEAMACGTPVLGTPVGAIPEIIGPFDKRLLFDGTAWPDIRSNLEAIIQNPNNFRFDSTECRKYVEENFSWEKMADLFEGEAHPFIKGGSYA